MQIARRVELPKVITAICLIAPFLFGTASIADTPGDAPNVFFISGKNYELTDSLLAQFRKSWHDTDVEKAVTVLTGDDRQWVFDYISVDQGTRTPMCDDLKLLSINPRRKKIDTLDGKILKAGTFDEAWTVLACDKKLVYRVAVLEGTSNLAVYEMNQHLPLAPDAIPDK